MRLLSRMFLLFALFDVVSFAQTSSDINQLFQIGTPDKTATLPIPMGQVNLSNGNLHIEIPLKTVPQRGGVPAAGVKLVYDSQFWMRIDYTNASYWYPGLSYYSGWRIELPPDSGKVTAQITSAPEEPTCNPTGTATVPVWSNFVYSEPNGTSHLFYLQYQQGSACNGPPGVTKGGMYADDGSGYFMAVTTDNWGGLGQGTVAVWDPHGNQLYDGFINGASSGFFVDSNGNSPTYNLPRDQQGRMSLPGVTIMDGSYVVNTNFAGGCSAGCGVNDYNGSIGDIASVALPDGRSYAFQYDQCPGNAACSGGDYHYGLLRQMTLPTGATVTFNYQNMDTTQDYNVSDLRVTSVSMSGEALANCANSSSWSGQTWSICYQSQNSYSAEIDVTQPADTTGSKNQIVYTGGLRGVGNGAPGQFILLTESRYHGLAQSGNLLRRTSLTYDTFARHITDVSTLRDDGATVHTSYSYWGDYLPMVSTKKEYDTSGALVRETDATYSTNNGPGSGYPLSTNISFPHYIDRPFSTTIYGPGGSNSTPVAAKVFSYDGTSLSTTSGTSGQSILGQSSHDDTNFGVSQTSRGNLTGISEMVQPGTSITTRTNYYNIFGQVVSSTDASNHTTDYDYYSNAWGDSSCSANTIFNYQTVIKDALNHETHKTYNSCDGSLYSVKDQNDINTNRSGTVYTYDGLARVTEIDYPDGGSETIDYGGNQIPEVITRSVATDMTPTKHLLVTTKTLDGLGRESTRVDADGAITNSSYDNAGNIYCVSNPHFGSGNPIYGTTCHVLDALGRETQTLFPGESGPNAGNRYQFSGNTTDFYDETGRHRKETVDDLGRLYQVTELGSTSSPANLLTTYGYNTLDNLTSVVQSGAGEGARSRYFQYDALGRLKKECNPERQTGSTCDGVNNWNTSYEYYDNNHVHTKTDARGVQTTYSYDPLDRLISKTYSGGSAAATRSSCYQYDTAVNGVGRIGAEWTQISSCPSSPPNNPETRDTVVSYDAMGRITEEQQCHRGKCSSGSPTTTILHHDLVGNLTYYSNGIGSIELSQSYDAGRLHTIDSSLYGPQLPSYPSNLLTVGTYSPTGSFQNMNLGPSIYVNRTYDDNRLRITGEAVKRP